VGLGPNTTLRKHHDHCGRRRRLKIDGAWTRALTKPELSGSLAGNATPECREGFPRMSELFSGKDRECRLASANKKAVL